MSTYKKTGDYGVSPVIGVMLMLVVTIIIAAVVSGFSGGLLGGNNQNTPTLTMDIKVANTGSWMGSGLTATVTGVSEPIPTKNLKIVTRWKGIDRKTGAYISGGNTSIGQTINIAYGGGGLNSSAVLNDAPVGFGPGISGAQSATQPYSAGQLFGNYSLVQGTGMSAIPSGAVVGDEDAIAGASGHSDSSGYGVTTPYTYTSSTSADPAQKMLGMNWYNLKPGDTVTVNVIYVPTGKVILNKNVLVTG